MWLTMVLVARRVPVADAARVSGADGARVNVADGARVSDADAARASGADRARVNVADAEEDGLAGVVPTNFHDNVDSRGGNDNERSETTTATPRELARS